MILVPSEVSAILAMDGTKAGHESSDLQLFWDIILAPICVYDISPSVVAFGSRSSPATTPPIF